MSKITHLRALRAAATTAVVLTATAATATPALARSQATVSVSGSSIRIVSPVGIGNQLAMVQSGTRYAVVSLTVDTLTAGPGCFHPIVPSTGLPSPGEVQCVATISLIDVSLGDGNDRFATGGSLTRAVTVHGGTGDDVITTSGGADHLYGEGNNDTLTSAGNIDAVYGGDGNDTIDGGPGVDTLVGNLGIDKITGGTGQDVIDGDNPGDLFAGSTDQIFVTDGESDRVECSGGFDTVDADLVADASGIDLFTCEAITRH